MASSFRALRTLCEEHPDDRELAERRDAFGRELLELRSGGIALMLEAASLWFAREPALCHEAFWRSMAERPSGREPFFEEMFAVYARLARGHELPSTVHPWVEKARRDRRLRPFVDRLALGSLALEAQPIPSEVDVIVEVATDGGLLCAGDCDRTEELLDGEPLAEEAARLHVLPWSTDGDGVFSVRVRTGKVRKPSASIELVTDELCVRGIGGEARVDLAKGHFDATIARGEDTHLLLVLQRVSKPGRWGHGDALPEPLAMTAAEVEALFRGPPKR